MLISGFKHVLLCICTFLTLIAYSQSISINGEVIGEDGETIPFAMLAVDEVPLKTTTDINGHYSIIIHDRNFITIKISAVGYRETIKRLSLHSDTTVDFVLRENVQTLNEAVVEHSVGDYKEKEGFAMEAVETSELQAQSIELNTVLDQTSGIKVRQSGGLGSRVNYTINGLGGRAVRFFIDGVPMDYFGSSYSVNTIPITLIDRIDIYKGVVPVELGNDALGGAINLITKLDYSNSAHLSYSFGSFNTHRASLISNYRDTTSGFAVKLSAFYNYSDNNYRVWGEDIYVTNQETFEIDRGVSARRFHDSFQSKSVKADLGLTEKKWADQIFAGVLLSDMDKDIQHGATMEIPFGEARYEQAVIMPFITYKKHGLFDDRLDINFFSSYSNLSRQRIDTSRNKYNWYGEIEDVRVTGGEQSRTLNTLTDRVVLNRLNLVYHFNNRHKLGVNYVVSYLERTNRDPLITTIEKGYLAPQILKKHVAGLTYQFTSLEKRLKTSLFSKFYGYDASVKDSETIQGNTRYFHEHMSDVSLGYGVASSFKVKPLLLLSASVENAYRLPETNEVLGDGLNVISSTSLTPEQSLNVNAGARFGTFDWGTHEVQFNANLFYRNTTDLIQRRPPGGSNNVNTFVYMNIDNVTFKGFDAGVKYRYNKVFSINQTLSYLSPIIKTNSDHFGNNNVTYNTRLPNTPFFQTSTDFRYQLKNVFQHDSKVFVYWNISYVAEFYRNSELIGKENKAIIPAQLVHNMGVGYTFPNEKISISFDLRNIFNEQVFDNYAIQKPGRAAYAKISYQLTQNN